MTTHYPEIISLTHYPHTPPNESQELHYSQLPVMHKSYPGGRLLRRALGALKVPHGHLGREGTVGFSRGVFSECTITKF